MNSRVVIAFSLLAGYAVTFVSGFIAVPWLYKAQCGKVLPPSEMFRKRNYTPSMGGILPAAGAVVALSVVFITDKILGGDIVAEGVVNADTERIKLFSGILMMLSYAFTGFFDDYIIASGKRLYGLSAIQKNVTEIIIILGYLYSLYSAGATYIFIPFAGNVDTGLFFWIIGPAVMHFTVKSVKLSDGTNGLCTGMSAVFAVAGVVIALIRGIMGAAVLCSAMAGVLVGFLVWNISPSGVRLGSTGSMLLGGFVVAVAYCVNMPWIILLAGIGYAVEIGSYAIHVCYYKATDGRKLLRKAPLNLHLEKCGLRAGGITAVFSAMNITGSVLAIFLILAGRPQ